MGVLLGLVVAVAYGSGDFLGGRASRMSSTGSALLVSQAFGLAGALVTAVAIGADVFEWRDALLGAGSGLTAAVGLACLYHGLAVGRTSVVAPISAVGGAVVQIGWGLANGEEPGAIALVGIVIALVAVALVAGTGGAAERHRASRRTEIALGVGAAIGLGFNLVLLSETSSDSGMWPVVVARVVPLPLIALALVLTKHALAVRRDAVPMVAGAGLLDATANVLLLVAVRDGLLSLVAPVAALYPGATVVLARLTGSERIDRARAAGLVLALVGLVLIAVR